MGREARAANTQHWLQLAEAVLELRAHVEALEREVTALKGRFGFQPQVSSVESENWGCPSGPPGDIGPAGIDG